MAEHGTGVRVDKVIRLVGASPTSWEDAARVVVADASKTIRELTVARVIDLDVRILGDDDRLYRVMLELAFRVDRSRTTPTGHQIQVHRYLVVGNATLTSTELERVVTARRLRGPAEVHVVVPAAAEPLGPLLLGDPSSGFVMAEAQLQEASRAASLEAADRLEAFLHVLERLDVSATGEVGPSHPVHAVEQVLARGDFDEIIVSTLPSSLSRWLRLDLPTRLRRATTIPVTHIETE